ncbi:MAG: response regulator [Methanospirillum sp.]|nr:response regulator [Methanospirillum sp.]
MIAIIPVLFVDDNRELSNIFQFYLEETGLFSVHVCLDGLEALEYIKDHEVEAVISDYDMPDMDGITLLRHIRAESPRLPFIMLTGNDSKETAIAALNSGADFYQNKAEDLEIQVLDLSHKITILVERAKAEDATRRKDEILKTIGATAQRLLQGSSFFTEMVVTLREICEVTGAVGAFIGDPGMFPDDPPGEHHNLITWWRDEPAALSRSVLADLTKSLLRNNEDEDDGTIIALTINDAVPEVLAAFNRAGITRMVLIPVTAGNERWGYFSLMYDGQTGLFSEPELHAFRMTAELAGAARYRAYMEEYFKNPVEKSLVGVFLIRNNRFIYINPRFSTIFGYSRGEILRSRSLPGLFDPHDSIRVREILEKITAGERDADHIEIEGRHRDGSRIFLELYVTIFRHNGNSCLIGNCLDITSRKEAEEKVRTGEELLKKNMMRSLREKETLLREIHHRVKNNMQIISSLLRLSDFKSGNPQVHDIIRDCRNRIYSMTAIHEKFYETDDLAAVSLGSYVRDIANRIITEFEMENELIEYEVISETPVYVDIGTGIPVGLMMNELITNSIKHAFPEDGKGRISISINPDGEDCVIIYSDTGIGLPSDFDTNKRDSLGIDLIRNLTTQIQGIVEFGSGTGMRCMIRFPLDQGCKTGFVPPEGETCQKKSGY